MIGQSASEGSAGNPLAAQVRAVSAADLWILTGVLGLSYLAHRGTDPLHYAFSDAAGESPVFSLLFIAWFVHAFAIAWIVESDRSTRATRRVIIGGTLGAGSWACLFVSLAQFDSGLRLLVIAACATVLTCFLLSLRCSMPIGQAVRVSLTGLLVLGLLLYCKAVNDRVARQRDHKAVRLGACQVEITSSGVG